MNLEFLAEYCVTLLQKASAEIEKVKLGGLEVHLKEDDSPVTQADLASEAIILQGLSELAAQGFDYPCLSEESADQFTNTGKYFWCVDPLDGTKDFIHQTGDYTINLALFEGGEPILGVIAVPQTNTYYYGYQGGGSWKVTQKAKESIHCRILDPNQITTVVSRFHISDDFNSKLEAIPEVKKHAVGSALKFCVLAEGQADFYPRFGPTSVWDIAAGHCILHQAGGGLYHLDHTKLVYDLSKPWKMKSFYAVGDKSFSWNETLSLIS